MIKELKKDSHKISKRAILSCMVLAAVTISNCTMVKALDTSNATVTTASSDVNTNGEHKFIIDSPMKDYDDINKAESIIGFKFKVPDYLQQGSKLGSIQITKLSDNDNAVKMYFDNENKDAKTITFQVSKSNHIDALKKLSSRNLSADSTIETEELDMKLGDISGKNVTLTVTSPSEKLKDGTLTDGYTEINKYFVWENDSLYYSIKYNSTFKSGDKASKERANYSEADVEKIAESIVYPEEAKSVDYSPVKREVSTEIEVMEIYDKEDLEKAKGLLGFNPKLPLKINDDISIKDSGVGIASDSDIKNNKINYELNSFYSNKNGSITFNEGRTSKEYDEIEKNGYFNEKNWKTNENMQIKAEKLNINNKEVFKYEEKVIEEGQEPDCIYLWKEDGIYYSVIIFGNVENSNEIAEDFINSKPID